MNDSRQVWRLILSPVNSGAMNMAIDEALLQSCQVPEALPVLRFFSWSPPCLSLGRAQSIEDVDPEKITQNHWEIIRRPTGGKGILHVDELTYSIVANANHPIMAGGVLPSYQRLSTVFLYALNKLGIKAESKEISTSNSPDLHGPVCFERPSNYEIVFQGKKLIGSAQARNGSGVLQHGSIPLFGDISRIVSGLKFKDEDECNAARVKISMRATTIQDAAGYFIPAEKIILAILEGFETLFNFEFSESHLSSLETKDSYNLVEAKYSDNVWLTRI